MSVLSAVLGSLSAAVGLEERCISRPPPCHPLCDAAADASRGDPDACGDSDWTRGAVWPGGELLASFLTPSLVRGRRVLELGCGTGIAGLAAADLGPQMFHRIQRAYYLEARNPSDTTVLAELAADLGLDSARFAAALASPEIDAALQDQFHLRRRLQATAFPSLVLELRSSYRWISRGWEEHEAVLTRLEQLIAEE